jgi:hypothetical protein
MDVTQDVAAEHFYLEPEGNGEPRRLGGGSVPVSRWICWITVVDPRGSGGGFVGIDR